jgi:hypothetical protein
MTSIDMAETSFLSSGLVRPSPGKRISSVAMPYFSLERLHQDYSGIHHVCTSQWTLSFQDRLAVHLVLVIVLFSSPLILRHLDGSAFPFSHIASF